MDLDDKQEVTSSSSNPPPPNTTTPTTPKSGESKRHSDAQKSTSSTSSQQQSSRLSAPPPAVASIGRNSLRNSLPASNAGSRSSHRVSKKRFSQYEAIPGVKVRDFAYPPTDSRHYGLSLDDKSNRSSTGSDWFSSDEDGDEEDDDDEDETASYRSAERLFESDDDSSSHAQVSAAKSSRSTASHSQQPERRPRPKDLDPADVNALVVPVLINDLRQHMGGIDLGFSRAKAMFDFQKVTEWEMTIKEGDELYIAYMKPPSPTQAQPTREESEAPEVKEEAAQSSDSQDKSADADPEEDTDNTPRASTTTPGRVTERWASIDTVADDLLHILHGASTRPAAASADAPSLALYCDPAPAELAAQLNQLLDYAGVYGTGWATALRFKCRARFEDAGPDKDGSGERLVAEYPGSSSSPSADGKEVSTGPKKKGKVKIRLIDMGLVPGNYIEDLPT
ncbi:hypothetical protein DFS34DRAFT_618759 [Phlyctochytrium arcticum]|nr:hypothetical protein DFS34DRAFT_618759 [Phlyctochytrium arcticum]